MEKLKSHSPIHVHGGNRYMTLFCAEKEVLQYFKNHVFCIFEFSSFIKPGTDKVLEVKKLRDRLQPIDSKRDKATATVKTLLTLFSFYKRLVYKRHEPEFP